MNTLAIADKQQLLRIYTRSPKEYLNVVRKNSLPEIFKGGKEPITIGELNRNNPAKTWAYITTCIEWVMISYNKKGDMSGEQVNTLVTQFIQNYYYWSLEELSLCLRGVINNPKNHEKNYGCISLILFNTWFQEFDKERDSVVQMIVNKPKIDISKDAVSKEDYEDELLAKAAGGDEDANKLYAAMIKRNEFFSKINYQKYGYDRKHKYDERQTPMEQNRRSQKRTY